jgi:UDP-3-O-[3-hydroxymyristoyl] glucosamine N-acyltransferase
VIYSPRLTLQELAERLGCVLDGDGSIVVERVATLDQAGPGDVSFLANRKYAAQVATTRASALIVGGDVTSAPCATLRAADPYLAFATAVALLAPDDRPAPGVAASAHVAADAVLGREVHIGALASIGAGVVVGARTIVHPHVVIYPGVTIGDDCVIHAHVSIRERCRIGHRVVIQNGAVVGSDGFGFAPRPDGTYQKIPQVGPVVIEDDVEIGANSAIDRPAVGETRIEAGTKIDNLVQVAHGVHVGRNVMLVAQVGISGSTSIGDSTLLAGQVGVAGHLQIGAGTRATAQTGIPNSLPDGSFVSGYPAIDNREWLKSSAVFRRLPELRRAVSNLDKRLADVEARLGATPSAGAPELVP